MSSRSSFLSSTPWAVVVIIAFLHLLLQVHRLGLDCSGNSSSYYSSYSSWKNADKEQEEDTKNKTSSATIRTTSTPTASRIPHRITFTHYKNLLDPKYLQNTHDDNNNDYIHEEDAIDARNVNRTISMFLQAWNQQQQQQQQQTTTTTTTYSTPTTLESKQTNKAVAVVDDYHPIVPVVDFLLDDDCIKLINETEPALYTPFVNAEYGSEKADICRVVALWHHGGYYLDIDLIVHQVPLPPNVLLVSPKIEFSTVLENNLVRFHQAYIAITPNHPLMMLSMQIMVDFYQGRQKALYEQNVGTWTMREAYTRWIRDFPEKVNTVYFLHSRCLNEEPTLFPEIERVSGKCWFNDIVMDLPSNKLIFWVRSKATELQTRYGLIPPDEGAT